MCLIPGKLSSQQMEVRLRAYAPPVITRLEKDRVMLDLRTIQEGEFEIIALAIREIADTEPLEGRV